MANKVEDLEDKLKGKGAELRRQNELLERAKGMLGEMDAALQKTKDRANKVDERYKELASGERLVVAAVAGGLAGAAGVALINGGVGFLGKYSAPVKKYEGYVAGGTQIVLGAGVSTIAVFSRGSSPGLLSDIAFTAGATHITFGSAKLVSTWWNQRKAQGQLVQQLVDERARLQAQMAAAAAQQQQQQRAA